MLKIELNRIDGAVARPLLHPDNVLVDGDEAAIALQLSADDDIELLFPAPGGKVGTEWLMLAGDVLTHLAEMDNDVQRACAEHSAKSGLHSSNYEGELAYIILTSPDTVELHYFGTKVNTEWDESFVRTHGKWGLTKPDAPGTAADEMTE